jgi:pilus assembly protein CpaF
MKSNVWKVFSELEKKYGVNEIVINSPENIFYVLNSEVVKSDFSISEVDIETFVRETSLKFHHDRNQHHPIINGVWPDGTRINIVLPPISSNAIITLKKYSRLNISLEDDQSFNLNADAKIILRELIIKRSNFIISGGIGVGKTTFLNMLLNEIPKRERIVIVEEIPELNFENKSAAFLHPTSKYYDQHLTLEYIIQNVTKMKADRLILGASKGKEMYHFIESISSGIEGSIATIHANSITDAILKLECNYQLEAEKINVDIARRQIFTNIDYVIHLGLRADKGRCIQDIYELDCDINHKTSAKKVF